MNSANTAEMWTYTGYVYTVYLFRYKLGVHFVMPRKVFIYV